MDNSEKTNTNFLSHKLPTMASVNGAEDETVSVNIDHKNEASLSGSVLRKDGESSTEIMLNKDGASVSETVLNKFRSPLAESLPNKDEVPSSDVTDIDEEVSLSQSKQNKDEPFLSEDMELSEDRTSLSEDVNEDWAYLSEGEPNMDEAHFPDDIYIVDEASPSESMELSDHEESLTENMPNKDDTLLVETIQTENKAPLVESTPNKDKVPIAQRITNEDEAPLDESIPSKNLEPSVESVPNQDGARLAESISNGDEAPIVQSIENKDGTPLVESEPKKDEASSSDDIEIVEEISFSKRKNKNGETVDLSEDGDSLSGEKDKGGILKQSSDISAHHSDSSKLTKNQRKKRNKLLKKEIRKEASLMQSMANQVPPKNYNTAETFPKAQISVTAKVIKCLNSKKWLRICVAVAKEGFPAAKLSHQEADLINMEILQLVDAKATFCNVLPIICRTSLNPQGALMVICRGGPTVQWLKKHFHNNNRLIPNAVLQILPNGLLPKLAKVAFKTREVFTEDKRVFLNRLQRFNPHLHCEDWRILARTVEPKSARYIFEVNLESCEAIQSANFKAFTGVDRGFFKFLSDPYAIPLKSPAPKNQP